MEVRDVVGNVIEVGDECMHVRKSGNTPVFRKVIIREIKSKSKIGIFTEGNSKLGWTYSDKLVKIIKE